MRHLLLGALILAAPLARSASFDCARASTSVERQICASAELSSLDTELAEHYSERMDSAGVRQAQRAWLRQRDACRDADCLRRAYQQRIAALACQDGPALGSAIGASTCARARLRDRDGELDLLERPQPTLASWRAARSLQCRREAEAAGGAPGWQAASAALCELAAAEKRLDELRQVRRR